MNTRSNTAVCLTLLLPTNITMQEVKYDYSFSGAGGASDSSGVTWKIYLEGNTSGKPAGQIGHEEFNYLTYETKEWDGGVLSSELVAELVAIVEASSDGISTSVPSGPGCSATRSLNGKGLDEETKAKMDAWVDKAGKGLKM